MTKQLMMHRTILMLIYLNLHLIILKSMFIMSGLTNKQKLNEFNYINFFNNFNIFILINFNYKMGNTCCYTEHKLL
jgi:hypothetical protein